MSSLLRFATFRSRQWGLFCDRPLTRIIPIVSQPGIEYQDFLTVKGKRIGYIREF